MEQGKETREVLPHFIVLEGIDGAGTTTQMNLLHDACITHGISSMKTCEPTTGPIGRLIRHFLSGSEAVGSESLALLFAADRREHLFHPRTGIVDRTGDGTVVISDRYFFSSLAYQSVECEFDLVYELNRRFPLPEHLVYIDVPVEIGQERLKNRSSREIFEVASFQEKVTAAYDRALGLFADSSMKIHRIDGKRSSGEIAAQIWSLLDLLPIHKA